MAGVRYTGVRVQMFGHVTLGGGCYVYGCEVSVLWKKL